MPPVTKQHLGTTLKRHAILYSAVKMCQRIEILLLTALHSCHGIRAELYQSLGVRGTATDACGCYIVRITCQTVSLKVLTSRYYQSSIVSIHITHKEPRPYTVVGYVRVIFLLEQCLIVLQQYLSLCERAAVIRRHPHGPHVLIAVMPHYGRVEFITAVLYIRTFLHIYPQSHLGAVKRWLLYV